MFDEFDEDPPDVHPESSDRVLLWAASRRSNGVGVTADEAWAILFERYPSDARLLVLHVFAELRARLEDGAECSDVFDALRKKLDQAARESAGLGTEVVANLLLFAASRSFARRDEDRTYVLGLLAALGVDVAAIRKSDPDRAGLRLRRFEREVLRELHDRTAGGAALGTAAARSPVRAEAPNAGDALAAALADGSRVRRAYLATDHFGVGELVEHPKFGTGLVTGIEPGKVIILFESGSRKLVAP